MSSLSPTVKVTGFGVDVGLGEAVKVGNGDAVKARGMAVVVGTETTGTRVRVGRCSISTRQLLITINITIKENSIHIFFITIIF